MANDQYDNLLVQALGLYKSRQLSKIPAEEEIDYEFSQSFRKKAEKLIRNQERPVWRYFQTTGRKAAAIILAIIIGFTATLSIDAVRESIVRLWYQVFSTHTDIEYTESAGKILTDYYTLPKVPDGYRQLPDALFGELNSDISWENEDGKQISLQQFSGTVASSFDSEDGQVREVTVNKISCLVCRNDYAVICHWVENGSYFELLYPSEIGEEYLYEVVGKLIKTDRGA